MTTPRTWGLLAATAVVSTVVVVLPGTARPAYPGLNGKIAFVSDRDDAQGDIYTMNADGSSPTRCSSDGTRDEGPAWSPDGTEIAFSSVNFAAPPPVERDIYVMDADCGNVRRLTDNGIYPDIDPTWSPDGRKVAYTSDHDDTGWDIYVLDLATGVETNLTNMPAAQNESPAWSPDGTRIAFESQRDNSFGEIYVMDADTGSNVTRVTTSAGSRAAAWSPDGTKIAFRRQGQVYARDLATGVETNLTNAAGGTIPAWSPDGGKIAFQSSRDGNWEIYVMDAADGSSPTRLTDNGATDSVPDWQPLPPPPPPAPCITVSETSVSVTGTASTPSNRGVYGTDPDRFTITNCGAAPVHLAARGTNATGAAGSWQLLDQGTGSTCELGVNVFRASLALLLPGGGVGIALTTDDRLLVGADGTTPFTLDAAAAQDASPNIEMPCVDSVGLGEPMTTEMTLTAIAAS